MREKSRGVTRAVTVLLVAMAVATAGLAVAPPASAVVSSVAYTLSISSATMPTRLGGDSPGPCADDATAGAFPYDVVRAKVSASGSYTVSQAAGSDDGRLGIYTGAFDPASKLTNCLALVDDNTGSPFTVDLAAGTTYTLVRSATAGPGSFAFDVDGPGALTVLQATQTTLVTTPNPSELSKAATLKATVTGGAPTGSVLFKDGATVLGSAPVSAGVAQLVVKSLRVGSHTLSAAYSGDGAHDVSADTHVHQVKYGPKPRVRLFVSDTSVVAGDTIRLRWVTAHADVVRASGDWKGTKAKKGKVRIKVRSHGVHRFKLRVTNVNGVDRAKVRVVAVRAPKDLTVTTPDDVLTAGTDVRVKAQRLDAEERFKVFLDDKLLAKGLADRRGRVNTVVELPAGADEGAHELRVTGSTEDRVGVLDIQVVEPTKTLDVEVDQDPVRFGTDNIVIVTGLVAGEDVAVSYRGDVIVEGTADDEGRFEYTFDVGEKIGKRTISVVGHVPGRTGRTTFSVQPAV